MSEIRDRVLERFLRYVQIDTQSVEEAESYPSTARQFDLLRPLVDELKAIGLADAAIDEWGYVTATVPATTKKKNVPTIGFLAHVDTSPEMPGAGVKPIVHRDYQGQDLVLPDDETAVLRFADNPALAEQVGNDIVTASGTTLLGADNKAGVAEVVTAAEYLVKHPEIPHGPIRVGFTPDEEVGRGVEHFDVAKFGAKFAYTMDGETLGEVESESFSADSMIVTFQGFNTHPGYGKGRLVNSIKIAADFITRLPKGTLSPETTGGYEGYVHPYVLNASVERTSVKLLIRDFKTDGLKEKEGYLATLARATVADWPGSTVEMRIDESYRNMREVIEQHPEVVENAREAIRRAGLTVRERPIRGGTDGSRLTELGVPTPNLFTGMQAFHGPMEWVSVQDMGRATDMCVRIAELWAQG